VLGAFAAFAAVLTFVAAGAPAANAATAPGPVQGLTVSAGNGFVTASWSPPATDGGAPVFAYSVVALKPDSSVAGWTNLLPDATSASVAGLANGVVHTVHVLAWNQAGRSVATSTATPSVSRPSSTTPSIPRDLTVTFASGGFHGPTAQWTAPVSDGGSPIVAYSMVTQYGRPPFLITRWTHVGPNVRSVTCSDCDANMVHVFAWNANGPGPAAVFGMFPF
jgi:hypothetical protein